LIIGICKKITRIIVGRLHYGTKKNPVYLFILWAEKNYDGITGKTYAGEMPEKAG
jgi:hypothetical protein